MKYKLIKTYPGSPSLDYIAKIQPGTNMYFYNGLQIVEINKYPEYWQPLPEHDREWANSLIGDLFAIATHVRKGQGTKEMADRLDEYAMELSEYFKDKLK